MLKLTSIFPRDFGESFRRRRRSAFIYHTFHQSIFYRSVFYTQSAVRSPQSVFYTDRHKFIRKHNVSVKSKLQHAPPPGQTPGIWHLCSPGEEGIWLSEFSRGWGIWSPCFRGGEFELHPRFHVKSLAWRAMGDPVLENFRGKDCAFVANWLRGKGLNKLCGVFEVFKF